MICENSKCPNYFSKAKQHCLTWQSDTEIKACLIREPNRKLKLILMAVYTPFLASLFVANFMVHPGWFRAITGVGLFCLGALLELFRIF